MIKFIPVETDFYLGDNLIETYEELVEHLDDDFDDLQIMCQTGVFSAWLDNIGRHDDASKIKALDTSGAKHLYLEICGIFGITPNNNLSQPDCEIHGDQPTDQSSLDHDATDVIYGELVEFRLPFSWDEYSLFMSIVWLKHPGSKVEILDTLLEVTFNQIPEYSKKETPLARKIENKLLSKLREFNFTGLHVLGGIPENKLNAAISSYPVPTGEKVLALIDATVFGSASNGMAIGVNGIYWKNDRATPTTKNFLSWEDLKKDSRYINSNHEYNLLLAPGVVFNLSGSGIKPKQLETLLIRLISCFSKEHATEDTSTKACGDIAIPELFQIKLKVYAGMSGILDSIVEKYDKYLPGQVIGYIRPEIGLTDGENNLAQTNSLIEAIERLESFWEEPEDSYVGRFKSGRSKEIPGLKILKTLLNNSSSPNKVSLIKDVRCLESFWENPPPNLEFIKQILDPNGHAKEMPNIIIMKQLLITKRTTS